MAASHGQVSTPMDQQTPCHAEKPSKIAVFHDGNSSASPAIDAAAAEFSAPLERFRAKWRPVRVKKTRQIKK
jgi:hypothetical protein